MQQDREIASHVEQLETNYWVCNWEKNNSRVLNGLHVVEALRPRLARAASRSTNRCCPLLKYSLAFAKNKVNIMLGNQRHLDWKQSCKGVRTLHLPVVTYQRRITQFMTCRAHFQPHLYNLHFVANAHCNCRNGTTLAF